jgi:hypothetical protein
MALTNRVLDSACHMGEPHCDERCDIDVAAGPLARQEAQRRGGNRHGSIADPNGSTRRASRGLLLRKGVWHIDKVLYGKRSCESNHTSDLVEAEALLAHRCLEVRRRCLYGRTFREAGVKSYRIT